MFHYLCWNRAELIARRVKLYFIFNRKKLHIKTQKISKENKPLSMATNRNKFLFEG